MNKSILMSIQPQWLAKILNGEKTIEIRKKFPKDYVGWVYIYCTKGKPYCFQEITYEALAPNELVKHPFEINNYCPDPDTALNGKVVGRFWCDNVEEIEIKQQMGWNYPTDDTIFQTKTLNPIELLEKSCLDYNTLDFYLGDEGYAIHISKLEVFDNPKELKNFYKVGAWKVFEEQFDSSYLKREQQEIMEDLGQVITKAPQSYMFIEGE